MMLFASPPFKYSDLLLFGGTALALVTAVAISSFKAIQKDFISLLQLEVKKCNLQALKVKNEALVQTMFPQEIADHLISAHISGTTIFLCVF